MKDYIVQNRRLKVAVIVLLILNFMTLSGLWLLPFFRHPPSPGHIMKRDLHFSAKQVKLYDELIGLHRQEMRGHLQDMRALKRAFYDLMSQDLKTKKEVDALAKKIGEQQSKFELTTFRHFAQVRALCDIEQRKKFDKLIHRIVERIHRRPPHPPGRKKNPI